MARLVRSLAATLLAVTLPLPAFAAAKLPVRKNFAIVPNLWVGGVKIGMKKAQAVASWGSRPRCVPSGN